MLFGRWQCSRTVCRWSVLTCVGWGLLQDGMAATTRGDNAPFVPARNRVVRHFNVQGGTPVQSGEVARWAEENAGRAGRLLESALRPAPNRSLEILLLPTQGGELTRPVSAVVEEEHGFVVQRLILRDIAHTDAEDALEQFVQLLLNEWRVEHLSEMDPAWQPSRIPAWMAIGIAQNLYPALRNRNAGLIRERHDPVTMPALAQVMNWKYLPAGRSFEKAVCGVTLAWLLSRPQGAAVVRRMLDQSAAGQAVTPKWLADQLQADSVMAMEAEWTQQLRRQERITRGGGEDMLALLIKLREQLVITGEDRQAAGDTDAMASLDLTDLIALRDVTWVRQLACRKAAELRLSVVGRDQGFAVAVDQYCAFFDGLARRRWGWTLRRRLAKAETMMGRLERITWARKEYLDRIEREWQARQGVPPPSQDVNEHLLERSALRDYVDRVEKQYGAVRPEPTGPGMSPAWVP